MAGERDNETFDLSGAVDDLFAFEQQMDELTGISVPRAADAMAEAFEAAGQRIETALERAARTGEVNFESLITSVLSDLARIGAGAVIDQVIGSVGGLASGAPPVTVNISVPENGSLNEILSAQGQIASAVSQAVLSGARWS